MDVQFVIGELSRRTGYSPAMIRYFEKAGVIDPSTRTPAGYRMFGIVQISDLRFVRQMQSLGFHTRQIKTLREIRLSDLPASEKRERVRKVFEEHARHVERKIAHFTGLKTRLDEAAGDFVDLVLGSERQGSEIDGG